MNTHGEPKGGKEKPSYRRPAGRSRCDAKRVAAVGYGDDAVGDQPIPPKGNGLDPPAISAVQAAMSNLSDVQVGLFLPSVLCMLVLRCT